MQILIIFSANILLKNEKLKNNRPQFLLHFTRFDITKTGALEITKTCKMTCAGRENRTLVLRLEGGRSTTKLYPQNYINILANLKFYCI